MFKKILGTKDIMPQEVFCWQRIEEISRNILSLYNYKEIRPPLIENAELFCRSLGETTEIVQKQMFLIKRERDLYALRPEGTASLARLYIENNLDKTAGFVKWYYMGAMFRAERPQKGRLRQFHHLGCEAIGSIEPAVDIEIISLADRLLKGFSIRGYQIQINSLGCPKDKKELIKILHKGLAGKAAKLCDDCRLRYKKNILRIMDCKKEQCRRIVQDLNISQKYLCPECAAHFTAVKKGLDILGINYRVTPHLVRGLDYYTRTVFEITHQDLGAQDALGAGGRYDNLVRQLGGPDVGAIGFAFGVERLLLVQGSEFEVHGKNLVYLISLGEQAKNEGLKVLDNLRKAGITSDTDYEGKSLKAAMRKANDSGARYVLLIGENEINKGVLTLKDMKSGEQKEVKHQNLCLELIPAVN